MTLSELTSGIGDRTDILDEIDRLIILKRVSDEVTTIPAISILNDFITTEIDNCSRAVKLTFKDRKCADSLDQLFVRYALRS